MNLKRKIEILGLEIPIFLLVAALIAAPASAALLNYYGTISGSTSVQQSVTFAGGETSKSFDFGNSLVAGTIHSSVFTLVNNADVSEEVELVTDQEEGSSIETEHDENIEGIDTSYYKLGTETWTQDQEYVENGAYVKDLDDELTLDMYWEGTKLVLEATFPSDYINVNGMSHIATYAIDSGADGTADFQIQYDGEGSIIEGLDWGYSEVKDGSWSTMNEVPSDIEKEQDGQTYIVKIPVSRLGGLGNSAKIGFDATLEPDTSGDQSGNRTFISTDSSNFWRSDYTSSDYWQTKDLGDLISDGESIMIESQEEYKVAIMNDFNIALAPGDYAIQSQVKIV